MKKYFIILVLLLVSCISTISFAYSKIVFNGIDDVSDGNTISTPSTIDTPDTTGYNNNSSGENSENNINNNESNHNSEIQISGNYGEKGFSVGNETYDGKGGFLSWLMKVLYKIGMTIADIIDML